MTPPPALDIAEPPRPSLPEAYRTVTVPHGHFWRRFGAFAGPGYLVAVGYMDPGNWATDLAGGSAFGYALLSAILLSSLMAMFLQALAARLGIAAGMDLAQACRAQFSPSVSVGFWLLSELGIVACDLAEVIGTAIALQLLFGIPLGWGVCLTALDVTLILLLQHHGFRRLEAFVVALLTVIAGCFAIELLLSRPDVAAIAGGLVPRAEILRDPTMLYLAVGILGATVMPHNLYLHSSIVQTRRFAHDDHGKAQAIRLATIDSTAALVLAFVINASILILAAATFHRAGLTQVAEIQQAWELLTPLLGAGAASTLFAIALFASGQNSTITATLAGQIVMEGFVDLRLAPWARRMVTRLAAIVPAAAVAILYGSSGTSKLLVMSQVVLSLQLPFAVIPLIRFTSDPSLMGRFAVSGIVRVTAWITAAVIVALNVTLLIGFL